uniref:Uncharacterized protein n=1 Tax=Rhizophora mucronata TaxID=61149 RepID=A0A2P2KRU1_RHIMU
MPQLALLQMHSGIEMPDPNEHLHSKNAKMSTCIPKMSTSFLKSRITKHYLQILPS